ncbi:MAG: transporter [Silicimonas sp.]|nr:transporter [Silicimonas sp.]
MRVSRSGVVFAACLTISSPVLGAPVTFNTALPIGGDQFVARAVVVSSRSGADPGTTDRDLSATALISVLGYGVTPRLAMFGVLPYADKDLDVIVGASRLSRSASGIGDVSLFGRFTLLQRDQPGRTFRVAPFIGIKAPTGDNDERDGLGRLPVAVQSGTGAWNAFCGVVATYQILSLQVDGQVSYRVNNEADGFDPGDEVRLDGSLQYRLWPRTLGSGVPDFLYGVLEMNLVHRDKHEINGATDDNSGGTTLYFAPGLQYVTKRWIVEGVVQLPVVENLSGSALETDFVVRAGVRFNF